MAHHVQNWINLLTVSLKVGILIIAGLFLIYSVYFFFLCIMQAMERSIKKKNIRVQYKEFFISLVLFLFFSFIYVVIPGVQYIE